MRKQSLQEKELSVRDLLSIFERHRRLFYLAVASTFLLAVLYCLLCTHRYEATATVQVDRASGAAGLDPDSLLGTPPLASDAILTDINLQTQAAIMQSNLLGLRTIDHLHLEGTRDFQSRFPDVIGWITGPFSTPSTPEQKEAGRRAEVLRLFEKRLQVKPQAGTRLLDVSFVSDDARTAAAVVNQLVEELKNNGYENRLRLTQSASETLSKQLDDLRTRSQQLEGRVAAMQQQTGIYSLGLSDDQGHDQAYSVTLDQFKRAATTMNDAEQSMILKKAIYQAAQTQDAELLSSLAGNTLAGSASSSVTNSLATIQLLRSQEATLQGQLDQLTVKFGPAYPQRQEVEGSIRGLEQSIKNETLRIRERARNDYAVAASTYEAAKQNYNALKGKAEAVNNSAIAYTITKQEADATRNLYEDLLRRLKAAGILQELRADQVTLVDPAIPPTRKTKPPFSLVLLGGLVAGLILGAVLILLADVFDDRVHSALLAEGAGIPVLGLLPGDPLDAGSADSSYRDTVHAVRARLLPMRQAGSRTVLLTGTTGDEGAETFAAALGRSAAEAGWRVLLVKADLRRNQGAAPAQESRGLSRLLLGESLTPDSIAPVPDVDSLFVLPSGPVPVHSSALLQSKAMRSLADQLRSQFDVILFEGPPALSGAADVSALAELSDTAVQIARMDVTTRNALWRAHELLTREADAPAALVFTGVRPGSRAFRDFYGTSATDTEKARQHAIA